MLLFQVYPFYVLRPKTVRFPNQKRTVLGRRTYGFGTETIKGSRLQRERWLSEIGFLRGSSPNIGFYVTKIVSTSIKNVT